VYPKTGRAVIRKKIAVREPLAKNLQPFLHLREKLESETLDSDSLEAKSLSVSPYFSLRTTRTVLLTQLKTAAGAKPGARRGQQ
jgi:hypothetical protein